MNAGVLAAGIGQRLKRTGLTGPKPLLQVAGRPLLGHALEALTEAGATRAWVVVNEGDARRIERRMATEPLPLPVTFVRRTTASSLETFLVLAALLTEQRGSGRKGAALVAMVDGVFRPGAARGFRAAASVLAVDGRVAAASKSTRPGSSKAGGKTLAHGLAAEPAEGLIAVTSRYDDDHPLPVAFNAEGRISAIGQGAGASPFSTAGLYLLPQRALAMALAQIGSPLQEGTDQLEAHGWDGLQAASPAACRPHRSATTATGAIFQPAAEPVAGLASRSDGSPGRTEPAPPPLRAFRDLLAWLVQAGLRLDAYDVGELIDVDDASDLRAAERLLGKR